VVQLLGAVLLDAAFGGTTGAGLSEAAPDRSKKADLGSISGKLFSR